MSAFLIGKMSSEDMVNSLKNYECLSLNYGMSNVTEAFFVDVSIDRENVFWSLLIDFMKYPLTKKVDGWKFV